MDMEGALRARIIAANTAAAGRVYWVDRPQASALPSITLQLISGERPQTHGGMQATRDPRVQVDVWASSHLAASQLMGEVIAALAPANTSNLIVFERMRFEGERDGLERLDTVNVYRRSIDLIVWHEPA